MLPEGLARISAIFVSSDLFIAVPMPEFVGKRQAFGERDDAVRTRWIHERGGCGTNAIVERFPWERSRAIRKSPAAKASPAPVVPAMDD